MILIVGKMNKLKYLFSNKLANLLTKLFIKKNIESSPKSKKIRIFNTHSKT